MHVCRDRSAPWWKLGEVRNAKHEWMQEKPKWWVLVEQEKHRHKFLVEQEKCQLVSSATLCLHRPVTHQLLLILLNQPFFQPTRVHLPLTSRLLSPLSLSSPLFPPAWPWPSLGLGPGPGLVFRHHQTTVRAPYRNDGRPGGKFQPPAVFIHRGLHLLRPLEQRVTADCPPKC